MSILEQLEAAEVVRDVPRPAPHPFSLLGQLEAFGRPTPPPSKRIEPPAAPVQAPRREEMHRRLHESGIVSTRGRSRHALHLAQILHILTEIDAATTEIGAQLHLGYRTARNHLALLESWGLVVMRRTRHGPTRVWSLPE